MVISDPVADPGSRSSRGAPVGDDRDTSASRGGATRVSVDGRFARTEYVVDATGAKLDELWCRAQGGPTGAQVREHARGLWVQIGTTVEGPVVVDVAWWEVDGVLVALVDVVSRAVAGSPRAAKIILAASEREDS
jgi:hypothetical protein